MHPQPAAQTRIMRRRRTHAATCARRTRTHAATCARRARTQWTAHQARVCTVHPVSNIPSHARASTRGRHRGRRSGRRRLVFARAGPLCAFVLTYVRLLLRLHPNSTASGPTMYSLPHRLTQRGWRRTVLARNPLLYDSSTSLCNHVDKRKLPPSPRDLARLDLSQKTSSCGRFAQTQIRSTGAFCARISPRAARAAVETPGQWRCAGGMGKGRPGV